MEFNKKELDLFDNCPYRLAVFENFDDKGTGYVYLYENHCFGDGLSAIAALTAGSSTTKFEDLSKV